MKSYDLRRGCLLLSVMAAMLCVACGNMDVDTPSRINPDAAQGDPTLGSHALVTHDQGKGTEPAITPAVSTKAGSTLLALSMGRSPNFAVPRDNFSNKWSALGRRHMYANGPFYTAMWAVENAKGGGSHTLSADKPSDPADEISLALIEIENGSTVKDVAYAYPQRNQPMTAGSVTTDGPAVLIAVWGGDGSALQHKAVPSEGFNVIDSYLTLGPTSGVQVAIAVKKVSKAGTYSVTWQASPTQGAACYLIAVE